MHLYSKNIAVAVTHGYHLNLTSTAPAIEGAEVKFSADLYDGSQPYNGAKLQWVSARFSTKYFIEDGYQG